MRELRGPWLWAFAICVHALWALSVPVAVDWDPRYYESVARNLATGRGAVSEALWNLSYLPPSLPFPADLHWMPLPSRVLVPGLWLWPAHGAQLVTVLLGACWAPLAARLARPFGAPVALGAGVCAAFAGAYARFLSTPDSIALYGVLGGLSWLALAERRWVLLPILAFLAGICRAEGALLGLCLAMAWGEARPLARLGLAASGVAAQGLWLVRNLGRFGDAAWEARRAATGALDYGAFVRGDPPVAGFVDRLLALLAALPGLLILVALVGLVLLPWPALWSAWQERERPWVRAAALYALIAPPLLLFGAPAVGGSGSVFRTLSAVFPALCALGALGLDRAGAWAASARDYPRHFVLTLGVGAFALGSVAIGVRNWQLRPAPPDLCPALAVLPPGATVFSADPLRVEALCGRPAVLLPSGLSAERAAALAARYDIRAALPGDPRWDGASVGALTDEARQILPGWIEEGPLLRAP